MSKATFFVCLLLATISCIGQEGDTWSFGLDFSFGLTDQTHSQSGFTATSQLFDYKVRNKVSHGLHSGVFARRKMNERWHLRTGLYWQDLTTKRLYNSISYKEGVELPSDLGPLPDRTKIRSTYGFISVPMIAEYAIQRKNGLPYIFEIGGGINYNLYTLVRESSKLDGVRTVTREAYVEGNYSPLALNSHIGLKASVQLGKNTVMFIGPSYDIFFQSLQTNESQVVSVKPRRFYLSTSFLI